VTAPLQTPPAPWHEPIGEVPLRSVLADCGIEARFLLCAMVRVAGGRVGWTFLARAFSALMTPKQLVETLHRTWATEAWQKQVRGRVLTRDGSFRLALDTLLNAGRLNYDRKHAGASLDVVVTSMTTTLADIDPWFVVEAKFGLRAAERLEAEVEASLKKWSS
jgi:hypothetical protein